MSSISLHLAGGKNTEKLWYNVEIHMWKSLSFPVKSLDTMVIIKQGYTCGNRCDYLADALNVAMYSMVTRSYMSYMSTDNFLSYWMRFTENLINVMAISFIFSKKNKAILDSRK